MKSTTFKEQAPCPKYLIRSELGKNSLVPNNPNNNCINVKKNIFTDRNKNTNIVKLDFLFTLTDTAMFTPSIRTPGT